MRSFYRYSSSLHHTVKMCTIKACFCKVNDSIMSDSTSINQQLWYYCLAGKDSIMAAKWFLLHNRATGSLIFLSFVIPVKPSVSMHTLNLPYTLCRAVCSAQKPGETQCWMTFILLLSKPNWLILCFFWCLHYLIVFDHVICPNVSSLVL